MKSNLQSRATVLVEIAFLPPEEGGKIQPPDLRERYSPHIVIQERTIREPVLKGDGSSAEAYLPVDLSSSQDVGFSTPFKCNMLLLYHPQVSYEGVRQGSEFTIREGARIIGHGRVLSSVATA